MTSTIDVFKRQRDLHVCYKFKSLNVVIPAATVEAVLAQMVQTLLTNSSFVADTLDTSINKTPPC